MTLLSEVRRKGLVQVAWASGLFVPFLVVGYWLESRGWHHIPWEFAIPAGWMLAGLLQLFTGVPFANFASRWDGLEPWQRGVFGIGILLGAAAVIFAAVAAYIFAQ